MGYVILFGWLILLPICVGSIFGFRQKDKITLAVRWMQGQFLLWAIFQVVAVYYILIMGKLSQVTRVYIIVAGLLAGTGLLLELGAFVKWAGKEKAQWSLVDCSRNIVHKSMHGLRNMWTKDTKVLAIVFGLLWLTQMLAILLLAVNDGDDAFYMAVANVAQSSDTMYVANVYSFGGTELTYRYALAPFPIWIAFLARISGLHTLVIGHIILGMVLITLSYIIYAQAGKVLFGDDRRKCLLFLIFIAVLYIWSNTSSHTPESFLLLRSRQGKALVAGIVFPAILCLVLQIGRLLEHKQKVTVRYYIIAATVILTGCLGSTLGGGLVILLWGSALLLLAIGYRRWTLILPGILSVLPGSVYALLYLLK